MSDEEVIYLSSDEDRSGSRKNLNKSVDGETKAKKRQLSNIISSNENVKKQKFEKSSSPEAGCSKDFDGFTNQKKVIRPQLVVMKKIPILGRGKDVFENFIETCLEKRNDLETKKILKKLEKSYLQLSKDHKSDDKFRIYIDSCREKITAGLSKDIYTPILDLLSKIKSLKETTDNAEEDSNEGIKVSEDDMKKIKVLKKSIEKCQKKIKELEEREVDFDDENDSTYIQEDRYKKRIVQLCNTLAKITGDKIIMKEILKRKIKRKDIPDQMTGITSVDEAILSFINSDVDKANQLKHLESQKLADHIKMPEYLDILKCVEKCNKDSNLDLCKEKMANLAKKAFKAVGSFLKNKRIDETKAYMKSLEGDGSEEDPAARDAELLKQLQKNKKEGEKKLEEVFKMFVEKQEGLSKEDLEKQAADNSDVEDSENESDTEDLNETVLSEEERHEENNNSSSKNDNSDENMCDQNDKRTAISIKSNNSESKIKNEKHKNVGKPAEVILDEDDDILVVNNNENLDALVEEEDPLFIKKSSENKESSVTTKKQSSENQETPVTTEIEVNEILENHIKSPQTKATTQMMMPNNSNEVKAPLIKLRDFAKPPSGWIDSSPEKLKRICKPMAIQQALRDLPECIDLTIEREKRSVTSSTRSFNPLASLTRKLPTKRVLIVKNVINNYNVPLPINRTERSTASPRSSSISSRNVISRKNDDVGKSVKLSRDKGADKGAYKK